MKNLFSGTNMFKASLVITTGLVLTTANLAAAAEAFSKESCFEARTNASAMAQARTDIVTARTQIQEALQQLTADIQAHMMAPPEDRERQVPQFTIRDHALRTQIERVDAFEVCIDQTKSVF